MFYDVRVGGPDPAPPPAPLASGGFVVLSDAEIARMGDGEVLSRLEREDRQMARMQGQRIALLSRFAALRPASPPGPGEGSHHHCEFAADEVAAATAVAQTTAASQVFEALALTNGRLPATYQALRDGVIDLVRAKTVIDLTVGLSDVHAAQADQLAVAKGRRPSPSAFRQALRRQVHKIDPTGAEKRRKRAKADREVTVDTRPEDGVADLNARLPAEVALTIYATLDRLAKALPPSDLRTLPQKRADILADLILGRHPHRTASAEVNVTVAASTLAGLDNQPGHLHGYGTITAEHARRLAADATWRRILYDPVDNTVLDVSRRRHPSPAMVRHVRARSRRCVFPGCARAAGGCDTDHTVPYSKGGRTCHGNLGPLCRHHHRLKDEGPWTLEQPSPGRFVWTTPTERTYIVEPNPHDDD